MKKLTAILAAFVATLVLPVSVLAATEPQISIPVSTIVRGDVGSTHELANEKVSNEHVGMVCDVNATAKNQSSVHPGNDLIVSSGGGNVVLKDVERESNGTTQADGKLTLGENVLVTLKIGKDKVFSGGLVVNFKCEQPPKEIEVCRDDAVITIKEDERLDTDTDAPCPEVLPAETVTTLPVTGAGGALAMVAGTGVFGTLGHAIVTKKRS